jgi:putative transposase
MTNIRRYDPGGRPVFITGVCHRREPHLRTRQRKELLLAIMREVKASSGLVMHAYVILDDHFHWLISSRKLDFSRVMQSLKLRFSHRAKKGPGVSNNTPFWQRRFWDHVIRDSEDLQRHLDYIYYNPVKHGQVSKPADYTWSSFNTHVVRGHYAINWGAGVAPQTIDALDFE